MDSSFVFIRKKIIALGFGTIWGWMNSVKNFFFGWTMPLKPIPRFGQTQLGFQTSSCPENSEKSIFCRVAETRTTKWFPLLRGYFVVVSWFSSSQSSLIWRLRGADLTGLVSAECLDPGRGPQPEPKTCWDHLCVLQKNLHRSVWLPRWSV